MDTKTIIALSVWEKAVAKNELHLLHLAATGRLIVYDASRNFLKPVRCGENEWKLLTIEDEGSVVR